MNGYQVGAPVVDHHHHGGHVQQPVSNGYSVQQPISNGYAVDNAGDVHQVHHHQQQQQAVDGYQVGPQRFDIHQKRNIGNLTWITDYLLKHITHFIQYLDKL